MLALNSALSIRGSSSMNPTKHCAVNKKEGGATFELTLNSALSMRGSSSTNSDIATPTAPRSPAHTCVIEEGEAGWVSSSKWALCAGAGTEQPLVQQPAAVGCLYLRKHFHKAHTAARSSP